MMKRILLSLSLMLVFGGASCVAADAAPSLPFVDPAAQGYLGLCDAAGHQIFSGSITAVPFAATIVSSVGATGPYGGVSRTATVFAYQPRNGVVPGEWSGEQLSSSSRYSNAASPMAALTSRDLTISDFGRDFPLEWNGYLQLRLFLGAADKPLLTSSYPSTVIQVSGDHWTQVDRHVMSCRSGSASSLEVIIPTSSTSSTTTTHPVTTTTSAVIVDNRQSSLKLILMGIIALVVLVGFSAWTGSGRRRG